MPDGVFFSIVIPTYNRADLIFETLDAVFLQTYANYEVIVVDNCSTDNTQMLLRPLTASNKIRYIRNDQNYERAYSRNVGLENARGDYLTLLDSDDFMYPDCLTDAANFIFQNPGIKVFHNKYEVVNQNREVIYRNPFPSLKDQYKALCWGNFMSAIGGFIHREVYTQFKFNLDPKMIGSEDYEFWFQLFARYKVRRIDKVNSGIREHPQRSVNVDAYDHLKYQCIQVMHIIDNDPALYEKFGKYKGRLAASFKLQELIVNYKKYPLGKKVTLLKNAAKDDPSIIFTRRYVSTLINTFKI